MNSYLEKKFVVLVFYNLKKVFDILETLNQWFRDFLTERTFRMKVGDTPSDETEVRCGVPKGSGTGPLCSILQNSLCSVRRKWSAYMFI